MILDRDWDVLLLLDACRYDYFEILCPFKGKLTPFDIGCNGTKKYMQMNFSSPECSDVVFVNHLILFPEWVNTSLFHAVIDAHNICWNQDYGTVLPEDNSRVGLETINKYPDKRIVIHYSQPHDPFLDRNTTIIKRKTHKQIVYRNSRTAWAAKRLNSLKNIFPPMPFWYIEKVFGSSAGIGEIYFSEGFAGLKKSYEYNTIRALNSMKKIVDIRDKKVVITSDHGKMLGEGFMYSHGYWTPKVVTTVPWFEVK